MKLPGFRVVIAALVMGCCSQGGGEDYAALRQKVRALGQLTAPAIHPADGFPDSGKMRALFFDGLPYRGKATRVFAWYGTPEPKQGKVPGIVLVHGGGGTAYREWVEKWNQHGFAAISIAVEGQTDEPVAAQSGVAAQSRWKRHAW